MKVHLDCHLDAEATVLFRSMNHKLDLTLRKLETMMASIAELQAAVARNTDAENSVVTLLNGISQQLKDARGDPAAIDAVIKQLDDNTTKLSEAVVANTPSA